jgi:hypothetical protein
VSIPKGLAADRLIPPAAAHPRDHPGLSGSVTASNTLW